MRQAPVLVIAALAVAISGPPSEGQEPQTEATQPRQEVTSEHRGTEESPVVVRVLPTPIHAGEAARDQQDRQDETDHRWWTVALTSTLALIGLLQLYVYALQAHRLRQTIEATDANATRQLRAYLTHTTGISVSQDRNTGWHFEIRPEIKNCGQTPAYKVAFACRANRFPVPLPPDVDLTLAVTNDSNATVGPGQTHSLSARLDTMLSDEELVEIHAGGPGSRRLYVYGTMRYEDAFGNARYTNFCQWSIWNRGGQHFGINAPRHNDSD